jgi:hypothetical protein
MSTSTPPGSQEWIVAEATGDQDQIRDHPFQPMPGWPDLCGYRGEPGDWQCGYSRAEHADQGKEPPNEIR